MGGTCSKQQGDESYAQNFSRKTCGENEERFTSIVVPRLRMSGAVSPLTHTRLWRGNIRLRLRS